MPNTISGGYETSIATTTQTMLNKKTLFPVLASFKENNALASGVSVNRPSFDLACTSSDYTANTDTTGTAFTYTQELMTVGTPQYVSAQIDPIEVKKVQANPDIPAMVTDSISDTLAIVMDRDFLDEVDNAGIALDASTFGGTADAPIDFASTGPLKVLSKARASIQNIDLSSGLPIYAVVDPDMISDIEIAGMGVGYNQADAILNNGFTGKSLVGLNLYVSNNLPSTITLTYGATGTNAKSTVIAGVTFNQVTTIGTTAGNVLMATDAATSATNLAALINAPRTTTTKGVALSAANARRLEVNGVAADASAADGTVVITAYGRQNYSSTDTNVSFGDQTLKVMVGQKGAIDMVAQMMPDIQINKAEKNLGSTYLGVAMWATKTFSDGAQRLCKVSVKG